MESFAQQGTSWASLCRRFPTTYPPAAEVEAEPKALGAALPAVEGGSPSDKVALAVAADKVRQTLELLGKVVQSVVRAGPVEDAPAIIRGEAT